MMDGSVREGEPGPTDALENASDWFERRFHMRGRSLSVPMNAYEDEIFQDFILRAAAENGITNTHHVVSLIMSNALSPMKAYLANLDTWIAREVLADSVGMSRNDFHPPFERTVRRGYHSFFGSVVRKAWMVGYRRVSPLSLSAKLYNRAIWRLQPIGFDPVTRETLLEKCPVCDSRMKTKFTVGIQFCDACAMRKNSPELVDLRGHPQIVVEVDDEEALEYGIALIRPDQHAKRRFYYSLHKDLASVSASELFELLVVIGTCLTIHGNVSGTIKEQPTFRSNAGPLSPPAFAEAARMILGWPDEFRHFIGFVRRKKGLRNHPLYTQFLTTSVEPRLAKAVHVLIKAERATAVTTDALAHAVASPPLGPEQILFQSALKALPRRGPRSEIKLLSELNNSGHPALSELQVRQTALLSKRGMTKLVSALGVPIYGLVSLVERGQLPSGVVDLSVDCLTLEGVEDDLIADVRKMRRLSELPEHTFSLAGVMNALSLRTVPPWAELLEAALKGEFEFWLQPGRSNFLFRSIRVRDVDAVRKAMAIAIEPKDDIAQLCVTTLDAALTLGVVKSQMWNYRDAGLLSSAVTLGELKRLHSQFINVCEIIPRLALCGLRRSPWSVADELRRHGNIAIHPVPLALRDRAAVEAYFAEKLWPCYQDLIPSCD